MHLAPSRTSEPLETSIQDPGAFLADHSREKPDGPIGESGQDCHYRQAGNQPRHAAEAGQVGQTIEDV